MRRFLVMAAMVLVAAFSTTACQTEAPPDDHSAVTEELPNCKAQCVQVFLACLRQAQTDEDRLECAANRDACMQDCEDCDEPYPAPCT